MLNTKRFHSMVFAFVVFVSLIMAGCSGSSDESGPEWEQPPSNNNDNDNDNDNNTTSIKYYGETLLSEIRNPGELGKSAVLVRTRIVERNTASEASLPEGIPANVRYSIAALEYLKNAESFSAISEKMGAQLEAAPDMPDSCKLVKNPSSLATSNAQSANAQPVVTQAQPSAEVDAGPVTVTGLKLSPVTMTYGKPLNATQSAYLTEQIYEIFGGTRIPNLKNNLNIFDGGENVSFSGGGANGVPSFTVSLVTPRDLTITAPVAPDLINPALISKELPFTIKWTNPGSGNLWITVAYANDPNSSIIYCLVPDNGSLTIPASFVRATPLVLKTSSDTAYGLITVQAIRFVSNSVIDDQIQFFAEIMASATTSYAVK